MKNTPVKNKVTLFLFTLIVFFQGCRQGRSSLTEAEYIRYINEEENGFIRNKEVNGISYEIRLNSPELMALKQNHFASVPRKTIAQEIKKYEDALYFDLIIKDTKSSIKVKEFVYEYTLKSQLLSYINTEFQKDMRLVEGEDTISCAVMHMEPLSKLRPELRFSLSFRKNLQAAKQDLQFVLTDEIFKNGPVKFSFDETDLNYLPTLKL